MLTVDTLGELCSLPGTTFGYSDWREVREDLLAGFVTATEDFEPIHLSRDAARSQGFPGIIAPGLYILSLAPKLMKQIYEMPHYSRAVNYGYERVRFTSRYPSGRLYDCVLTC
jgi:acyl dehydratase